MGESKSRRTPHRGRRRKKKKGSVLANLILVIAVVVFCVSAFMLAKYAKGYLDGRGEYDDIRDLAITGDEPEGGFRIDFDELLKANADTVGWIRFYPEPSEINYPVVQGEDNEQYLHKTFSANENTLGAIFLAAENGADFSDRNSIIYGHRMKDGSMFRHLEDYENKEFWEENQYFYIYTPDGHEKAYHIYSAGIVDEASDIYQTDFASDEEYQAFLDAAKEASAYDTGIEVGTQDRVVTLSTCTKANDNHRYVVIGVLEKDVELKGE